MVHEAVLRHYEHLSGLDFYLSGPPAMVYGARDILLEKGVPEQQLFSDAFEFNSQMDKVKG